MYFIKIPKELFLNPLYEDLNSDSILLYGLLLDRLSISMKNNIIYVRKINHQTIEKTMNRTMSDSRVGENTIHESEIVRRNNKYNNTNYSKNINGNFQKQKSAGYEQRQYKDGELEKLYCNFKDKGE